jgi:hypothetical protein
MIQVEKLRTLIPKVVRALTKYDFDALAFRGMSGTLIGPSVALAMDKTMILVRKPGVDCHSTYPVEGDQGARRYIIIDDMISSGATAKTIINEIKEFAPNAECLGVIQVNTVAWSIYPEGCTLTTEVYNYNSTYDPLTYKPKENTSEKATDQESPKASQETIQKTSTQVEAVYPSGLRISAEGGELNRCISFGMPYGLSDQKLIAKAEEYWRGKWKVE